ncbi:hypothetical protein ACLB2K_011699 [Fragaria x ananassa]
MIDYESGGEFSSSSDDQLAHLILSTNCDSLTFEDAVKEKKWKDARDAEIRAIQNNGTWELTDLLKGQKSIRVKWVFKRKLYSAPVHLRRLF